MSSAILGISAFYHDSAAAIVIDGKIIAAAQEERFTRKKHDDSFPVNAALYVMEESGIDPSDLKAVVFYEKPFIKFERLLETYHGFAPFGLTSFVTAIPVWIKEKLFIKSLLKKKLLEIGIPENITLLFPEHHLSHAASAFYPSPFKEAAILTVDGVGEWATTTIGHGIDEKISILKELHFPHSIGLLYSAFTYYCGFRVNSGEYKLMGLAPYGISGSERVLSYISKITNELIDIKSDGSILLNMGYFNFAVGLKMCNNPKWNKLFGIPRRKEEDELSQEYMDMALAIQLVTNEIVLMLAKTAKEITNCPNLVMAGGVALNCVSNGKLLESGLFENIWIQPAAGDAGGALGAALAGAHLYLKEPRKPEPGDSMNGSYLGPEFTNIAVEKLLTKFNLSATYFNQFDDLVNNTAQLLNNGKVIGWFQGRMEFGPRALGNRSILGDARYPEMQKKMNLKIKFRESFRPFAPAILEEDIAEFCKYTAISPYMLFVLPLKETRCISLPENYNKSDLYTRLYFKRSDLPAITHIDYSARVQTVSKLTNERFWKLIDSYKKITGNGLLINTSFNVRGEPIVCTPADAVRCFMNTDLDYLVINNYLFDKSKLIHLKDKFAKNYTFKSD